MRNLVKMQQVHGAGVVRVGLGDAGTTVPNCDALISNDPGVILSVRTADCLPIAITDKKSHSFGLIHAGWRGLDKGIIGKTLTKMAGEFLTGISDVHVVIGPHICRKHYEVKQDVSSKFAKYPGAALKSSGNIYLDLALIARRQLIDMEVKDKNIKVEKKCTFEDKGLFSYRRDRTAKRNTFDLSGNI